MLLAWACHGPLAWLVSLRYLPFAFVLHSAGSTHLCGWVCTLLCRYAVRVAIRRLHSVAVAEREAAAAGDRSEGGTAFTVGMDQLDGMLAGVLSDNEDETTGHGGTPSSVITRRGIAEVVASCVSEWEALQRRQQRGAAVGGGARSGRSGRSRTPVVPKLDLSSLGVTPASGAAATGSVHLPPGSPTSQTTEQDDAAGVVLREAASGLARGLFPADVHLVLGASGGSSGAAEQEGGEGDELFGFVMPRWVAACHHRHCCFMIASHSD